MFPLSNGAHGTHFSVRHQVRRPWATLGMMIGLALASGCGGSGDRARSQPIDACLHWTACITPPRWPTPFAYCAMGFSDGGGYLPWPSGGVPASRAQVACLAAAGLDCVKALDCVSAIAPTPCPSPTWNCDGDAVTRCDAFGGSRVVTEDCAAEGLHCVPVGGEAFCGLAACDVRSFTESCVGTHPIGCVTVEDAGGKNLGAVERFAGDCGASNADCVIDADGVAQCIGRGPACTGFNALSCQGDVLISCDLSGHELQTDCAAEGLHCVPYSPNPGGFDFGCAQHPGLVDCTVDANFGVCTGTKLQYCDDQGNETLDCKALGYSGCDSGHCVP